MDHNTFWLLWWMGMAMVLNNIVWIIAACEKR